MSTSRLRFVYDDKTRPLLGENSLLRSSDSDWAGLRFEHRRRPIKVPYSSACALEPHLLLVTRGTPSGEWQTEGTWHRNTFRPGMVSLVNPHARTMNMRFSDAFEFVFVELTGTRIAEWNRGGRRTLRFADNRFEDEQIVWLVSAMVHEVRDGCPSGRLYAGSISTALFSYVKARYASVAPPARIKSLAAADLEQLQAFIFDNLSRDIGLDDLAAIVGLTPAHLCRSFKKAIGMTPYQFLLHARVERAKTLMGRKQWPLAQIALTVGFSSQSHFTVAFRSKTGMSPKEFIRSL